MVSQLGQSIYINYEHVNDFDKEFCTTIESEYYRYVVAGPFAQTHSLFFVFQLHQLSQSLAELAFFEIMGEYRSPFSFLSRLLFAFSVCTDKSDTEFR